MSTNAIAEATQPLWTSDVGLPEASPLTGSTTADVVVVGAGIAGLSTAYELAREGRSVIVLDAGLPGGGMTARTTAHLASALDNFYHELISLHGVEQAAAYGGAQAAAINRMEQIAAAEDIDCDFRRLDGYLVLGEGDDPGLLDRELEACHAIGFTDVVRAASPLLSDRPALRFPDQGRVHILKYVSGLAHALGKRGVRLHGGVRVTGVTEENGRVTIETEPGHKVECQAAVVATNSPINDYLAIHAKQAPYRTYAMAFEVPSGTLPDVLLWDTLDPYHYVRLQEHGDGMALIVGGEDHKTGEASDYVRRFAALTEWTRQCIPTAGRELTRWSGQVMEPVDALPFSGRNPGNAQVYVHTGDSGQGITNGVLGAMLIADLIGSRPNAVAEACEPSRKPLRAIRDLVTENVTVAKNLAARLLPSAAAHPETLAPGEGAVMQLGNDLAAVSRGADGQLTAVSASCTHAGCTVHWNALEQCWDCPCHGSQFAPDGSVLNGPAFSSLPSVPIPQD